MPEDLQRLYDEGRYMIPLGPGETRAEREVADALRRPALEHELETAFGERLRQDAKEMVKLREMTGREAYDAGLEGRPARLSNPEAVLEYALRSMQLTPLSRVGWKIYEEAWREHERAKKN